MQSGTPPPLTEGTAVRGRPTWTGSPKEPPAEKDAMEVVDYNPPWTARERVSEGKHGETPWKKKWQYQGGSHRVGAFLTWTRECRIRHHFFFFRRKREGWRLQQVRPARHTSRQRNRSRRWSGRCSAFCRSSKWSEEIWRGICNQKDGPDLVQETRREKTSMNVYFAQLLLEFWCR